MTTERCILLRPVASCPLFLQHATESANRKRGFEAAIKRNYYHVKPLPQEQIEAWRRYLEFAEEQLPKVRWGKAWRCVLGLTAVAPYQEEVGRLYERCLIPCANYTEFWKRYAAWKVRNLSASVLPFNPIQLFLLLFLLSVAKAAKETQDAAIAVLQSAVSTFVPRRPEAHLALAKAYEGAGKVKEATSVLDNLLQ